MSSRPRPAFWSIRGSPTANGSLEWAADSRTLFYVWLDEEHRPRRVLRHTVGADGADAI